MPPLQVPLVENVRTVLAPLHVAAGGALHTAFIDGYEHEPPLQEPGAVYVRRVLELAQSGAGAAPQVTPAQGSGLHAPLAQPNEQAVSLLV